MSVYWITFRIDSRTVSGRSYEDRYDALVEAVNEHATDAWDETTSFWLIESDSSRSTIARSIKSAISASFDLVLVGSMKTVGVALIGKTEKLANLKRLVPGLQSF